MPFIIQLKRTYLSLRWCQLLLVQSHFLLSGWIQPRMVQFRLRHKNKACKLAMINSYLSLWACHPLIISTGLHVNPYIHILPVAAAAADKGVGRNPCSSAADCVM